MINYIPLIRKFIRVNQWVKNLFVFLPLFFSGQFLSTKSLLLNAIVFVGFSFTASTIYCLNDIYDLDKDRLHPKKSKRPLASGQISLKFGYGVMLCCFLCAVACSTTLIVLNDYKPVCIFALYLVINIAYTIWLKHFSLVDVLIIAFGFVLRLMAGAFSANIVLSEWIVIMTFLLSLFMAFAKRRDDLIIKEKSEVVLRNVTTFYNKNFIDNVLSSLATIIFLSYLMYCTSQEVMLRFHSKYVYVTSIFVLSGILRYLQITFVEEQSGNPTEIFLKDRFIQGSVVFWIASFFIIIYLK